MSHNNQPEYFTLISIDEYDGSPMVLGIFENMGAVTQRLLRIPSSCGSEYHIECFHLSSEEKEKEATDDILEQREIRRKEVEWKLEKAASEAPAMQPLSREAYAAVLSENEEHDYPELATSLEETTEVDS
tara:strand:+ start:375 stop:764 length:390 start_codon:yes stop_codon:yes gene_type:complete